MAIPQLPRQPVPTLDNNKQCISCSIPISHSLAPSLLPHRPNRSLTWVPNVMWHHILHLHLGCLTTHQVLPALDILIHHSDSCRGHRARHIRRAAETAAERSKHRHGQGHQHVRLPSGLQYHSPLQRVEGTPGCSPYSPQPGTYNCHHLPRVGLGRDHSGSALPEPTKGPCSTPAWGTTEQPPSPARAPGCANSSVCLLCKGQGQSWEDQGLSPWQAEPAV